MLQNFISTYIDFRKIGAIPAQAPDARAVWISQRLRWRRHSAEGSRACLQAGEGACRRTRALFHVLRGAASPAKTRRAHMKTMALDLPILEYSIYGTLQLWQIQGTKNAPTVFDCRKSEHQSYK